MCKTQYYCALLKICTLYACHPPSDICNSPTPSSPVSPLGTFVLLACVILFVRLQVAFRPRYGLLGQVVLFNFSTFQMVRCLSAHVVNEQEARLLYYQLYSSKPARKT